MHINTNMHDAVIIYIISNISLYVQVRYMSAYKKSEILQCVFLVGYISDFVNVNL